MASPILFEKLARPGGEFLAYLRTSPVPSNCEVIFLGGFKSDMSGRKAAFLRQLGARRNFAVTTFDYYGHGQSSGQFTEGTISQWLDDTLAVIDHVASDTCAPMPVTVMPEPDIQPRPPAPSISGAESRSPVIDYKPSNPQSSVAVVKGGGFVPRPPAASIAGPASPPFITNHVAADLGRPVILVGSSMGGWLMTLAALKRPQRVKALIGLAAAPDFTEDLIWNHLPPAMQAKLMTEGTIYTPSEYSKEGYPITRKLIEDGRQNLVLRDPIPLDLPIHLIHGTADRDVPWEQSRRLMDMVVGSSRVSLTLVKGADHRLSTPEDLSLLEKAIEGMEELVS